VAEVERSLAVFIDFENLALGFQGRRDRFDIVRVLERLVEKGKIVVKKAYADWSRFSIFTFALHEAAIELIEIPRRGQTGKNSADIRLCVDAMDLAYSKEHIDTFVVLSGDSDFSPLVSKLKELGKHVIGLGMQDSTSDLLRDNCDEFIYYEDLGQNPGLVPNVASTLPETKRKAFELLLDSLQALRRENKEVLWSSMIKDTMKRKKPSFNETYHGYRTFSELLEDAQREGLLELETDKRSRTYVVTRFGPEMHGETVPPSEAESPQPIAPLLSVPILAGAGPVPDMTTAAVNISPQTPASPATPGSGRRKSRRRRRRGQGVATGNGTSVPAGQPVPVAGFQPVVIPPPGPVSGIEIPPPTPPVSLSLPFDAGLDEVDKSPESVQSVAEPAPATPAEVSALPSEEPTPVAASPVELVSSEELPSESAAAVAEPAAEPQPTTRSRSRSTRSSTRSTGSRTGRRSTSTTTRKRSEKTASDKKSSSNSIAQE